MKKLILIFSIGIIITAITLGYASGNKQDNTAAEKVKQQHLQELILLKESISHIEKGAESKDSNLLQKAFLESRLKYKAVEPLLDYIDPGMLALFNGPNINKVDPEIFGENVVPPKGFQVLEELIFSEEWEENLEEIIYQTKTLELNTNHYYKEVEKIYFTDRIVIEAARLNLIRIFSLGLSGFDSPVIKNSLPEAAHSLEAIRNMLQPYKLYFEEKSPDNAPYFFSHIKKGIHYLQQSNDFNKFDRFYFLKEYINPLYSQLYQIHKATGIETTADAYPYLLAVNYDAENIFNEDFLNPYFYNRLRQDFENEQSEKLGQLLFFDPVLSADLTRSCASCHDPEKAFTDGLEKSVAFGNEDNVLRNAPTLINAIFQKTFFHDGRVEFPEDQVDHVIFNGKEFNSNYELIISRLNSSSEYKQLFREAYPDYPTIDGHSITKAMADYLRNLVALDSEFDKYVRDETSHIKPEVKNGFNLFMGKAQCGTCHFAPTFNGTVPPHFNETELEVLGVTTNTDFNSPLKDTDEGKYHIFPASAFKGAFKTPTIRNISLTAPYMHNGAFQTLEQVMDFYNKGGGAGLGLNIPNQTLPADALGLTKGEINDIISFMNALQDTSCVTSKPFNLPVIEGLPEAKNRVTGGVY